MVRPHLSRMSSRSNRVSELLKFWSRRRAVRRRIEFLRQQMESRTTADRNWVEANELDAPCGVLSSSLAKWLGWSAEKIAADDEMASLFLCDDDLKLVDVQMDLEDWLGRKIDPEFFNGEFVKFTFRDAVEWLSANRGP